LNWINANLTSIVNWINISIVNWITIVNWINANLTSTVPSGGPDINTIFTHLDFSQQGVVEENT